MPTFSNAAQRAEAGGRRSEQRPAGAEAIQADRATAAGGGAGQDQEGAGAGTLDGLGPIQFSGLGRLSSLHDPQRGFQSPGSTGVNQFDRRKIGLETRHVSRQQGHPLDGSMGPNIKIR